MYKINILLLLVISILFAFCKHKLTCKDLENDYYSITKNLRTKNDTISFIEELNYLIKTSSFCSKAYQVRGFFKTAQHEYLSAKTDFLKALKSDSSSIYSLYCLSSLYNLEGLNDSALQFVSKAIKIKSSDDYIINFNNYFSKKFDIQYNELIFFRGIIYYEMGFWGFAKNDFLKSINYNHDLGEAYAYLSVVYLKLNNIDSVCYYHKEARKNYYTEVIDSSVLIRCQ